ncbi:MAG: BREX-1 system adenine-specific DNA-methyltransferase PglX [Firmicutes bacterium]|nr:BREX-1 system adenine-specific DNA-methyltransferase PglX [Bacillota bacterium]
MDKNAIKKYAVWARKELIERVSHRASRYEVKKDGIAKIDDSNLNGRLLSPAEKRQREAFVRRVNEKGYEQVMEEAAYTWFNRFAALRFMEVNGYLPSHVRVFTNDQGEFEPQILTEALHLDIDGLNIERVYELKEANDVDGLFKYLLITQCNALNSILPGMFQKIDDYTELLLPDNLLREGSVIYKMVKDIPEEDWKDQVQIIGWLYQYYNTEAKDKVFADLKKKIKITKEKIPAATQLFTPDWIVRYMVENSLGRLWLEGHPNDDMKANWKYYLDEAEQEPEVEAQLDEIRKSYKDLKPEDLKCIDPCCGSGHILCYMFDVLMQIYETYGYIAREAAAKIVENNLYGLDIDDRAVQLSYFAVMMKARQYDRRFLTRKIQPQIYSPKGYAEGEEFGSLIIVEELEEKPKQPEELTLFDEDYEQQLNRWNFRRLLSQKYDVVVTNPPYMGASNMNGELNEFVKKNYPNGKSDLFACFIERGNQMIKYGCYNSMVTMQSWMFLSSFEKMRNNIIQTRIISNLMHMENMVMGIAFGTAVTVFRNLYIKGYKGTYNHIKLQDIEENTPKTFPVQGNRFAQVSTDNFSKIPGSPVAYWVSEKVLLAFINGKLISDLANVKIGMGTGKNEVFIRMWWEVCYNIIDFSLNKIGDLEDSKARYFPYNKGGEFRLWFGNLQEVLWFDTDGRKLMKTMSGHRENGAYDWYCQQGLTWSFVSSSKFGVRFLPNGCFFDVAGSMIFSDVDNKYILGFLSSCVGFNILNILNPTLNYQAGNIKSLPLILNHVDVVDSLVDENIAISKSDWDSFETSWDFISHPMIINMVSTGYADEPMEKWISRIETSFDMWKTVTEEQFKKLKSNEEELNRIFIDIYGLQDELTPEVEDKDVTVHRIFDTKEDVPESMKGSNYVRTKQDEIKSLISYAVGCMFGRYSLDKVGLIFAGGSMEDTFSYYSGTFADIQEYKLDGKYTFEELSNKFYYIPTEGKDALECWQVDADNIIPISDDEYFNNDIVKRFTKFIETVYGKETLEENLQFIADALGVKGTSREIIRNYFINDFYSDHCKVYKKRPIYWLFDSGKKNAFKCLIYMHRYQPDTIARIRTDYIHSQQSRYQNMIVDYEQRISEAASSEKTKLKKQLSKIQAQEQELREYEEKIHHLADQMISIDLDDGVKHNYQIFKDVLSKIK